MNESLSFDPATARYRGPIRRVLEWLTQGFALFGGLVLLALISMSLISIVGRKLFTAPIRGGVATSLNAKLVARFGPQRMLAQDTAVAALSSVGLALLGGLGVGGLPAVVICVVLYVSVTDLIGANCLASRWRTFPSRPGPPPAWRYRCSLTLVWCFVRWRGYFTMALLLP